jgi:hypothetical protein
MTPTRCINSQGGMSSSNGVSLLNQFKKVIIIVNKSFFEAWDLKRVILILLQLKLLMIVQKIIQFAAINLIHGYCHSEIS